MSRPLLIAQILTDLIKCGLFDFKCSTIFIDTITRKDLYVNDHTIHAWWNTQ